MVELQRCPIANAGGISDRERFRRSAESVPKSSVQQLGFRLAAQSLRLSIDADKTKLAVHGHKSVGYAFEYEGRRGRWDRSGRRRLRPNSRDLRFEFRNFCFSRELVAQRG